MFLDRPLRLGWCTACGHQTMFDTTGPTPVCTQCQRRDSYPIAGQDVCDFGDCDEAPVVFRDDEDQNRYCHHHEKDGRAIDGGGHWVSITRV